MKKATGEVDASNTAVAYSSCRDCKTVAAAIQVVLVSGEPASATPENVAVATNYQCTECETLAAAYQFVFGDGQELEFTREGKERLHELKKRDDLTLPELAAHIAAIAAEVAVVVDTETQLRKAKDAPAATTSTAVTSTTTGPALTTTTAAATSTTAPSTTVVTTTTTSVARSTTTTAAP